jgi:hypothetical protein
MCICTHQFTRLRSLPLQAENIKSDVININVQRASYGRWMPILQAYYMISGL